MDSYLRDLQSFSQQSFNTPVASKTNSHTEFLYLSGALGFDPETNSLPDSPLDQMKQIMKNINAILQQAGSSYSSIVRSVLYLTSSSYQKEVDEEYHRWFQGSRLPTRTVVIVKQLPRAGKVELDLVSAVNTDKVIQDITSDKVPKAIGPFVTTKRAHANSSYVFATANGIDPASKKLASSDIAGQTKQAMTNLKNILGRAGSSMSNVMRCTIYITDMANFLSLNEEYAKWFNQGEFPTRTCVAVSKLPDDALVLIDLVAIEEPFQKFQSISYDDIPNNSKIAAKKIRRGTQYTFVSGVIGLDEKGHLSNTVAEQTSNIFKNLSNGLKALKSDLNSVFKANIYVTSLEDLNEVNKEYSKWFLKGTEPLKLAVCVPELPQKARVQIEFVVADRGHIRPKL